jgi:sugar phosphate isomerase/epimerase
MFWKSMEELLPVFEREGVKLRLEPHPDDFVEDGKVPAYDHTASSGLRYITNPPGTACGCTSTWRSVRAR